MDYLLDTHTFLWFINDDPSLSLAAKRLMENSDNALHLSVASLWEMAIKVSLGRLKMPAPFDAFVEEQLHTNMIMRYPIRLNHLGLVTTLSFHHRDPFDRLIIAQALTDDVAIIGKDK